MLAKTLKLIDFRNHAGCEIEFSDGVNVIYGENASGKTNILEAVFFFAAGKSFRACKDRELIRFGRESAAAELRFSNGESSESLGVKLHKAGRREFKRNGSPVTKLLEYLGAFRAVIFTPDHLSLIKGHPENRRRFIDLAICQSFPRYVSYLSEYNRLLTQKNALLRNEFSRGHKLDLLSVYNEKLAYSAGAVGFNRRRFLKLLEEDARQRHLELSGGQEELTLEYVSGIGDMGSAEETRQACAAFLAARAETEIQRGISLFGVHKDDINVCINGKSARFFASQGQQRSAVLSLKLAEGELSKRVTGEYPVFLLDDILSELDEKRRGVLLKRTAGQVILTGCESKYFAGMDVRKRIRVERGELREES